MRLFPRKAIIAINAIQTLSAGPLNSRVLAGKLNESPHFVSEVLCDLAEEGWVKSKRGPGGGYMLTQEGMYASIGSILRVMGKEYFEGVAGPDTAAERVLQSLDQFLRAETMEKYL